MSDLVDELRNEAGLCRNETATDVAELLESAADRIEAAEKVPAAMIGHMLLIMQDWKSMGADQHKIYATEYLVSALRDHFHIQSALPTEAKP